MSKETQQIVVVFVALFSACSFSTYVASLIGGRWYSCRSDEHSARFDIIFSLWSYCQINKKDTYDCFSIDDAEQFKEVLLDFWIMRVLGVTIAVCAGSAFLLALTHCVMQSRKITRKITIMQVCFAIATVVLGMANVIYSTTRGQDIVGIETKFTFGWSCVIGWIGTIVSLLSCLLTIALMFIFLDNITEHTFQVREELNMDTLSISSETLERLANAEESVNNAAVISNDIALQEISIETDSNVIENNPSISSSDISDGKNVREDTKKGEQKTINQIFNKSKNIFTLKTIDEETETSLDSNEHIDNPRSPESGKIRD